MIAKNIKKKVKQSKKTIKSPPNHFGERKAEILVTEDSGIENERNENSTINKLSLKDSLYNLFDKPPTDFSSISNFNNNLKPILKKEYPKINFIKKLKSNMLIKSFNQNVENFPKNEEINSNTKNSKKKLNNIKNKNIIGLSLDFESDSSDKFDEKIDLKLVNLYKINFFNNLRFSQNLDDEGDNQILNFKDLLDIKNDESDIIKYHNCKYCDLSFKKHTALGGHIAKNHPYDSKTYKKKKLLLEDKRYERKIELTLKQLE